VTRPSAPEVADRALVLYALARRAAIELAMEEFGDEPTRLAQAEGARRETDRWLDRESLRDALTQTEVELFAAISGTWPHAAVVDGLWRREALAVLLWAIRHIDGLPAFATEADPHILDDTITRYGSVSSFRAQSWLRPDEEIDAAWQEADAWFGATEGQAGEDATLASISAERVRALNWLRDRDAAPA
jgi:uncharacterized protein DUF4272